MDNIGDHIVRVRGIPFSAGKSELQSFFAMCKIRNGKEGIHFTYLQHGRPSGEAFVEFDSEEELQKAIKMHKEYMGSRYIEVFIAQKSEFEWVTRRNKFETFEDSDAVLRLRGCPFGTTKEDVVRFFAGLEIAEGGIVVPLDSMGRPGGEAYALFKTKEIADDAMKLNREKMGHRYIELFKSSAVEMKAAERGDLPSPMPGRGGGRGGGNFGPGRPGPYDRMDGMGGGFGGRNIKGPGGRGGMGFSRGGGMGGMGMGGDMNGYGGGGGEMGFGVGFGGPRGGMGGGMMGGGRDGMGYGMRGAGMGGRQRTGPGSDHVPTTGHAIHMRGLPWKVSETDICVFFNPLVPAAIHVHFEPDGRAKGTADVDFATYEEASEGMKKAGEYIENRYVDLFLNSDGPPGGVTQNWEGKITQRSDGFTKTVTPSRMGLPGAGMRAPGTDAAGAALDYGGDRSQGAAKDEGWGGSAGSGGWGGGRPVEPSPKPDYGAGYSTSSSYPSRGAGAPAGAYPGAANGASGYAAGAAESPYTGYGGAASSYGGAGGYTGGYSGYAGYPAGKY